VRKGIYFLLAPLAVISTAICGCATVTPDTSDTTPPKLTFQIHYKSADPPEQPVFGAVSLNAPHTGQIETSDVTFVDKCVYVEPIFAVYVQAEDTGGISSIIVGPSKFLPAIQPHDVVDLDIFGTPNPGVDTQGNPPYPNPGYEPGSNVVRLRFDGGKAYDSATLKVTYKFAQAATIGAIHADAYNFGQGGGTLAQVYHFYVRPAGAAATEQPGVPCAVPSS
jgi:hypothetical protein